jgi:hypothetical protein
MYPGLRNSSPKGVVIPDDIGVAHGTLIKAPTAWEQPMSYQLVGGVTAHQGDDG